MSTSLLVLSLALFMVTSTLGHSQMRCAKYDMATGACYAPIRNSAVAFEQEDNDMTSGGGVCQSPMTNPISDSYANGPGCPDYAPCPDPMGSIAQGENFTIMWLARNHAEADQTPGIIALYLSPVESMSQGVDVSTAVFETNRFCVAPFSSCNGQNGNFVQCYASCIMPQNTVVGVHTLWWKWDWKQTNSETVYTTCADVYVTAGSGSTPSVPAPTVLSTSSMPVVPVAPLTTGMAASAPVVPVAPMTTGMQAAPVPVAPMTTGMQAAPVPVPPMTTGMQAAPVPVPPMTTGMQATPVPVPPMTTGMQATPVPVPPMTTGMQAAPAPIVSMTTGMASASTPSTPSTLPLPCNLGDQVCVGDRTHYQTCTNGRDANYWAPSQPCNVNTKCHESTNPLSLNKIYCY